MVQKPYDDTTEQPQSENRLKELEELRDLLERNRRGEFLKKESESPQAKNLPKAFDRWVLLPAAAIWLLVGILGCLTVTGKAAGGVGVLAGLLLLPLTMFVAPVYALITNANWELPLWVFGGLFLFSGAINRYLRR